jgi:hypothetical protein
VNNLGSSKATDISFGLVAANNTIVEIYDGSINNIGTGVYATYIVANSDMYLFIKYFTT